jgi:hypothetical protein
LNLVNLALFGERYVEVKARPPGRWNTPAPPTTSYAYRIGEIHPCA